ncbi:TnsA endonuclease N-terminal domain-containing protein [Oryzomonas rubra]|uniref:TnsA endonuclease N-terminal domain-containing protein n=1 Tax=Oryzomonas rubra TaxID=2509454 RepID=A0A5A9X9U8_9BACT|nr:TnsA endonuclease N-terminal domain-containing protein [Oryzomonas rubra]KAA0889837.1 hypothetical protein ET418_13780 [Oryzomonas rubra]
MRKSSKPTYELVRKWIKRGDGQGEGRAYRPFFHVRDVPSLGRSTMVHGLKTNRTHHYLSDIEFYHHICAEFCPDVVDIREQYALLPWEETQTIATQFGIIHPRYPGTQVPIVMTSDIVLTTTKNTLVVFCIKPSAVVDAASPSPRMLEKLSIEKEFWRRRGIAWTISTERRISLVRARNLTNLRISMVSRELDWLNGFIAEFVALFPLFWGPHKNLDQILADVGKELDLPVKECFCIFGRAVWLRLLTIDLEVPIDHFSPVRLIQS